MKKIAFIVFLLVGAWGGVTAKAAPESNQVRFEKIEVVPIKELWSLTGPDPFFSKSGAVIGYWRFDPENVPRDGDWIAVGIAIGGLGDLGEKPVAVKVWVKGGVRLLGTLSADASSAGNDAIAAFGVSEQICAGAAPVECAKSLPHMMVSASGNVIAAGVELGAVE